MKPTELEAAAQSMVGNFGVPDSIIMSERDFKYFQEALRPNGIKRALKVLRRKK
jgi:hypothetical protein